jgi:low affinity Fe/Cu permease
MKKTEKEKTLGVFERMSAYVTAITGSTYAFLTALSLVVVWLITGPFFDYSETWQLIINTGTTIITFLMVFLIQKSQNKDSLAIQLKLNELVAAHEFASNRLVSVEDMTEDELKVLRDYYSKLANLTKSEHNIRQSHSIDEATRLHDTKKRRKFVKNEK